MEKMFKQKKIPIADLFYSIQGEGFNVGTPSVFVRFAGCNLKCPWCDSWWAVEKLVLLAEYNDDENSAEMLMKYLLHKSGYYIHNKTNVVFTGGEPTLYQSFISKMINSLPEIYKKRNDNSQLIPSYVTIDKFLWDITFEIETNGIIYANEIIDSSLKIIKNRKTQKFHLPFLVFEVSPKLIDNIMNDKMIEKTKETIQKYKEIENKTNSQISFICKFVTDGKPNEIELIEDYVNDLKLSRKKVYLMPKCSFEDSKFYSHVGRTVANVCLNKGWRFSPREHIILYDKYRAM